MAKSLRSKRKRKVRAEKRVINAKKELVKLKEIAAKLHAGGPGGDKPISISDLPDVEMRDANSLKNELTGRNQTTASAKLGAKWMNQRKIKKVKRSIKKHQSKKSHSGGSSSIRSRKVKKGLKK